MRCADPACNLEFTPLRPWHRYHSPRCRARDWSRSKSAPTSPPEAKNPGPPEPTVVPRTKASLTIHCVVELS